MIKYISICLCSMLLMASSCKNAQNEEIGNTEMQSNQKKGDDLYFGVFIGKLMNDNVTLELDGKNFDIKINDKKYSGTVIQMDDGESFELESDDGKIPYVYFKFTDEYSLVLLNKTTDEEGNVDMTPVDDAFLDKEDE